jgi:hypothetical protein
MTEQQEHLSNLINQRQSLSQEIMSINAQANEKRELLLKIQGVIEYLTQTGVTLPEPDPTVGVGETE